MPRPAEEDGKFVVVAALGSAQTLAWASTYYLPGVLADQITASLDLPQGWFFAIFSGALLVSGLLGPAAGRAIDRRGGRDVLAASNLVIACGLLLLASAVGIFTLALAWLVLGIGMALGLYDAAFATLAGLYREGARGAITGITLIAGFASTLGWPATAAVTHELGWRGACVIWAVLHLAVGLPLNRLLIPPTPPPPKLPEIDIDPAATPRAMILLAWVFAGTLFVSTAMAAHLPRLLVAMGASSGAALAAGSLIGPAQVAARLLEFRVLRRMSPLAAARLATALHPIGAMVLASLGPAGAVTFALLHGAGNGMLTIARGVLPLAIFGANGYGQRTGLLSAPGRVLQAAAPLLFGAVLDHFGPRGALLLSGVLSLGACVALLGLNARVSGPER